jgi:hypothetical protein
MSTSAFAAVALLMEAVTVTAPPFETVVGVALAPAVKLGHAPDSAPLGGSGPALHPRWLAVPRERRGGGGAVGWDQRLESSISRRFNSAERASLALADATFSSSSSS